MWIQQYAFIEGKLVWRDAKTTGLPPNKILIQSPYDIEARNRTKRNINWTGQNSSTKHCTCCRNEFEPFGSLVAGNS
ncbi:MAG: hypothetical protein F6K41_38620 [Symploca sp. SIO3E6]|nr:hypothetical protein [Caldora sp. SIO3E6]